MSIEDDLISFTKTTFNDEIKDKTIRARVSASQKQAIERMASDREMNSSELLLALLQYEKDNGVILKKVMEEKFKVK
jgi:predicted DNA binding CopG/RHH family protein